jgi:hypothetical protein
MRAFLTAILAISRAEYITLSDLTGKALIQQDNLLKPRYHVKSLSRRVGASSGVYLSACYFPQLTFALSRKTCKDLPGDVVPTQTATCANVADVSALDLTTEVSIIKFIKENKSTEATTLSFGYCGNLGQFPDVDPLSAIIAFVIKDDAAALLSEEFSDKTGSYMVPVMALKASVIPENQARVRAALSTALHATTPVARKEALETIKAASVKLATLRN